MLRLDLPPEFEIGCVVGAPNFKHLPGCVDDAYIQNSHKLADCLGAFQINDIDAMRSRLSKFLFVGNHGTFGSMNVNAYLERMED